MKKTAIVILNWNGQKFLQDFLPILLTNTPLEESEIIVADNGSTDNSIQLLKESFPEVSIIELKHNYGFAEGYNRALANLQHEYLVLLNSDIEVTPKWLNPMIDFLDHHPTVAACQPKILAWYAKDKFEHAGAAGGFIDYLGYPYCRGRIMHYTEQDFGQYDTPTSIFWATGACLCIRNNDFRSVGGLDGNFFAHMEEIDLCWRLKAQGHSIYCIPQSTVYHVGGGTLNTESPFKVYLNFRNNLLMLYKNLSKEELNKIMFARLFLDALASLNYLAQGKIKHFTAVWKARVDFHKMKPDMRKKRQDNQLKAIISVIPERTNNSILVDFYIKNRRHF